MTSPGERAAADDVREDGLTRGVIGCAITVHRTLGCGLLESAYDECLAYELVKNGFGVARHVVMPIIYDGVRIELGYRPDLIIDGELIVEIKTVSQLPAKDSAGEKAPVAANAAAAIPLFLRNSRLDFIRDEAGVVVGQLSLDT